MITYYHQLINIFIAFPILFSVLVVSTVIAVITLAYICLGLFLDETYRPDSPQYPFNIILDRIIPLIAILMPTIIILYINPETLSWIEKFGCIILLHIFVLTPIMYYWSHHRQWDTNIFLTNTSRHNKTWNNPKLYLDLTLAMIYPAVFGICFFLLRYFRLGITVDVLKYITLNTVIIGILFLLIYQYTIIWLIIITKLLSEIKNFFWESFKGIIISLCLILLKYHIFFKIFEKIYQLSFLWITFIICHRSIYKKKSYIRKKIHYFYVQPFRIWAILFIIILLELIFNKGKLQYSLYILFIFLLIRPVISGLNHFNGPDNNWVATCNYINYINYDWANPYYPRSFWLSFTDIRQDFNQYPTLTLEEQNHINNLTQQWKIVADKMRKRDYHIFSRLITNPKTPLCHRIRLLYYYNWTKIK